MNAQGDTQHSLVRTVVLHLLPGALIVVFYVLAAPVVKSLGFPALLPMVYAVWWKKNLYVGVVVHVLGNISTMLLLLPVLLGAS